MMKTFSTSLFVIFSLCAYKGQKEKNNYIIFLDAKYQATGFFIPDISNPYPTYTYSDKKMGIFSVDFIGKKDETQYFWNPNNSKGYFSKSTTCENDSKNSKVIKDKAQFYIKGVGGEATFNEWIKLDKTK